ncbi:MAG: hypothetical protein V3S79_02840 [Candidatus Thermoplasmatota archaeon]
MDKQELIIKSIGLNNGVGFLEAKLIWESQFRFLREIATSAEKDDDGYYIRDSFKNLKLLHWGKYAVRDGRVEHLNSAKKRATKKKENVEEKDS